MKIKDKGRKKISVLFLLFSIFFTSCIGNGGANQILSENQESVSATLSVAEQIDDKEITSGDSDAELIVVQKPIDIQFSTEDGTALNGRIFPAKDSGAPLIILMHWAPGDQTDWAAIATWMQNGGAKPEVKDASTQSPWMDTAWFPEMPTDQSYNVFTFTFRNCEGGCKQFLRGKWYEDVKAAVDTSIAIEGIDQSRVIMIGASIGSDGAVDGCAYLNQKAPATCLGAMALSPGNYLTLDFVEMVKDLNPIPVWCLYAETDPESAPLCGNIESDNFRKYAYPATMIYGNGHGMNLIEKSQQPNPLDLILQFLDGVL